MNDLICIEDLKEELAKVQTTASDPNLLNENIGDWICKFAPVIIMALKIAVIFVGKNEKEIIRAIIAGLQAQCSL